MKHGCEPCRAFSAFLLLWLLGCGVAGAATIATVSEDVTFGERLVAAKFQSLGIGVLTARLDDLTTDEQKKSAYQALASAHESLARIRHPKWTPQQENDYREAQLKSAQTYRDLLARLGPAVQDASFEGLMKLRGEAELLMRRIPGEPSPAIKAQLSGRMIDLFKSVIKGFEQLEKQTKAVVKKIEEKEPTHGGEAVQKRYREKLLAAQQPRVAAGVELNRSRYRYYKALLSVKGHGANAKKTEALLETVAEELDTLCAEFNEFVYTVVGQLTLARAQYDRRKYAEAQQACEPGLLLLEEFFRLSPDAKRTMMVWKYLLDTEWARAAGKLGEFDKGIERIKDIRNDETQFRLGELYLMKAQALSRKKDDAGAKAARRLGKAGLDRIAELNDAWAKRVFSLYVQHGVTGAGWRPILTDFKDAARKRDNASIIELGRKLLAHGDQVPARDRSLVLKLLAMAYRQGRRYHEAYTIYTYLAFDPAGASHAEQYANLAVVCLQSQYKGTTDSSDKRLLDIAKKWQRDHFGGPGKEYGIGMDLKDKGRHLQAIREGFDKVPEASLYRESALVQTGECYVHLARSAKKANPALSEKYRLGAAKALNEFLAKIKVKTRDPKIADRRKRLKGVVIYWLATLDMWTGKEDYKALVERTEGYFEQYPDLEALHPYVSFLRVRALARLGQTVKAEAELADLRKKTELLQDAKRAKTYVNYACNLIFRGHVNSSRSLRKQAEARRAEAAKLAPVEKKKAGELLDQAENLEGQANEAANRALELITELINKDPDQPFDIIYYVVHELMRLNQYHKAPYYIKLLVTKYGSLKGLNKDQIRAIQRAPVLLGIAYFHSGEYGNAYKVMKHRMGQIEKRHKDGTAWPTEYWEVRRFVAKSAKESKERRPEARTIFLDLHKRLKKFTADWWDVTVSITELRNMEGQDDINLLVIDRYLNTKPDLGGREIRGRYLRVLDDIYRRSKGAGEAETKRRTRALSLMVKLQGSELKDLQGRQKFADMVRVISDFGTLIDMGFGGQEGRSTFLVYAQFAAENAQDEKVKNAAQELVDRLKE